MVSADPPFLLRKQRSEQDNVTFRPRRPRGAEPITGYSWRSCPSSSASKALPGDPAWSLSHGVRPTLKGLQASIMPQRRELCIRQSLLEMNLRRPFRLLFRNGQDSTIKTVALSLRTEYQKPFYLIVMKYDSEEAFIDSLSSLAVGRPVSRWDDSSVAAFDREVHAVVTRIEESAWAHSSKSVSDEGLKNLAAIRIRSLFLKLVDVVGENEARRMVTRIMNNRS